MKQKEKMHSHGFRFAVRTEFEIREESVGSPLSTSEKIQPIDLTVSNPTRCRFLYEEADILPPLAAPEALHYDADPIGMLATRQAVAGSYYAPRGIQVDADRILLTTSTSESYGYLLRLLCDPGDEILVPQPSYPLFDLLAVLHDVRLVEYPLVYHDGWQVDLASLEALVGPRTRAIVVVNPNNPTGHFTRESDRQGIEGVAAQHRLAIIADEVFLDYPLEAASDRSSKHPPNTSRQSFASGTAEVPTFVLSGLSKVLALPQMKLAWTVVRGPEIYCSQAMERLSYISDTFLSLNVPVQHAAITWLREGNAIRKQISDRTRQNLASLDALIATSHMLRRLHTEAGWAVILRIPAIEPDEEQALHLAQTGVLVHPGSFYGLPGRGWLVLSLLPENSEFVEGIERLARQINDLDPAEPKE